jgi:hypothetical protein
MFKKLCCDIYLEVLGDQKGPITKIFYVNYYFISSPGHRPYELLSWVRLDFKSAPKTQIW